MGRIVSHVHPNIQLLPSLRRYSPVATYMDGTMIASHKERTLAQLYDEHTT